MLQITAMDGGKGDSFIVNDNGKTYMVDGGNKKLDMAFIPHDIDIMIITHNDVDHLKGAIDLLENDEVDIHELWLPGHWQAVLNFVRDNIPNAIELDYASIDNLDTNNLSLDSLREAIDEDSDGDDTEFLVREPFYVWGLHNHRLVDMVLKQKKFGAVFVGNLLIALDNILRIAELAYRKGIDLLWFMPYCSLLSNAYPPFRALNARQIARLESRSSNKLSELLSRLYLTIENKYCLVFEYISNDHPVILFSGDSDYSFIESTITYNDSLVVTVPHHGSESNANFYSAVVAPKAILIRSGGTKKQLPGNSFRNCHKDKYCNYCHINSLRFNPVTLLYINERWIARAGYRCHC